MKITNGYEKRKGWNHVSSYLGNSRTKQEIFRQSLILYIIRFLVFIGITGEDTRKWIEAKNLHKKTLLMGSFMAIPNKVYPCFHFFSKTSPSYILNMSLNSFSWSDWMECLLNCHTSQFPFLDRNNKEKPNTGRGEFRDWSVKIFLCCITYWEKISNFYSINY